MKKILILSANPKDTSKLRLDEEVREIEAGLERCKYREQFQIISKWAVRSDTLRQALLEHEPSIVHFCGHGSGSQGLALENKSGDMQLVSTNSLAGLFGLFKGKIECVVLNACYSEAQSEAIYQHVDCVVGMNQAIGDKAAIQFAKGFYDGLGAGRTFEDAFEFGRNAIDLEEIPEVSTPVIKSKYLSNQRAKNDVDWKKLALVIVHSKEVYIPLNINQSPFNVGVPIELPDLNLSQVQHLIQLHGLSWTDSQVEQLINLVDGHPYLLRVALYEIARGRITLNRLLETAPTDEGFYNEHLRRHLLNLQEDEELLAAFKRVVAVEQPVDVGNTAAFKLRSLGLVKLRGNSVTPLCDLYRQYFRDRLDVRLLGLLPDLVVIRAIVLRNLLELLL